MNIVMIKMLYIFLIIKVGVSVNRWVIIWLVFIKVIVMIFIVLKNFDVVRWKKVNLIIIWKVSEYLKNFKYVMGNFIEKDVGNRICIFFYIIIYVRSF